MRSEAWILAALVALAGVASVNGQVAPVTNPLAGNREAVRDGRAIYEARCATCHGANAAGAAGGCDLTSLWTEGGADQPLFQTIRRGFANTLKPHGFGPDKEVWAILAYLSTLDAGPEQIVPGNDAGGNAAIGERLFWANCGGATPLTAGGANWDRISRGWDRTGRAPRSPIKFAMPALMLPAFTKEAM